VGHLEIGFDGCGGGGGGGGGFGLDRRWCFVGQQGMLLQGKRGVCETQKEQCKKRTVTLLTQAFPVIASAAV
jgi:hypothetical protein